MHQSLVKFSESEASNHTPSLADLTTTTPELKFSVHTGAFQELYLRLPSCGILPTLIYPLASILGHGYRFFFGHLNNAISRNRCALYTGFHTIEPGSAVLGSGCAHAGGG
jgi:hypothetical protein